MALGMIFKNYSEMASDHGSDYDVDPAQITVDIQRHLHFSEGFRHDVSDGDDLMYVSLPLAIL